MKNGKIDKFPIGFWNYTKTGDLTPASVKDWADLGMTFALSPRYTENCSKQAMLDILDACEEKGIGVIVCDDRTGFRNASDDPVTSETRFRAAYEDFGRHPAVIGFHVGDEPSNDKDFDDAITEYNIQLRVSPELMPFLNFLPYWYGQEKTVLKAPTFADWAKSMAKKAELRVLCYDCYAQMNPGDDGVELYFTNLRKFCEAGEAAGIDPWTTLLSVGHFLYRVPNEDDLRWQLNTAVASGMKGILWFFVYERSPISNYRLPPIDEFGERTETFARLSRVNRHFLHQFGEFFRTSDHLSTYHTVRSFGGFPLFEAGKTDGILLDVTCDQGLPAIVSFFGHNGEKHVAVVNNSMTQSGLFKLHVHKNTKIFERLTWERAYADMRTFRGDAFYSETPTELIGGDWLAPGQMKVYRLG